MDTAKQFSLHDKARPRFVTTLRRERVDTDFKVRDTQGRSLQLRGPTQEQINQDKYDLVSDLRPSNVMLALADARIVAPRPVLLTYRGRTHRFTFRQEVVL